ncbi:TetR/AcrR family transcriptional regulator [Paractinoplanes maris]|uniref:TetR/AcrR family transcriptional regulator n=1 Tax=Paractinoplanes maris TaxID=1734446 RepID=UPI002021022E|nr:TetR/AcrR family transcriptional regulator [Actinoplanes maris]
MLTAKGRRTLHRIVDGATAELRERGVDELRLEDVMARTGVSKGQLFHYFPDGKEGLLLAVVRREADQVLSDQEPYLSDLTSWMAWQRWRDRLIDRYVRQGDRCPLRGLLGDTGRRIPAAQSVLTDLIDRWQTSIVTGIRCMQETGEVSSEVDASRTAASLIAGIQGGVLLLTSTGRTDYLESAVDNVIEGLKGHCSRP